MLMAHMAIDSYLISVASIVGYMTQPQLLVARLNQLLDAVEAAYALAHKLLDVELELTPLNDLAASALHPPLVACAALFLHHLRQYVVASNTSDRHRQKQVISSKHRHTRFKCYI